MGIAEQMGRVLQRTSISVNIKERLDFSCALFGPDGSLVANAPHLPVHLGAMSEAIRYQVHQAHPAIPSPHQVTVGLARGNRGPMPLSIGLLCNTHHLLVGWFQLSLFCAVSRDVC